MEIIKQENYKEAISKGYVLVDFFAQWCGPCKMLAPVLEELSEERKDIKFIKVDVDEAMDVANELGIMSIPTLYLFKDGQVISKTGGYQGKNSLNDWLNANVK